MLKKTMKKKPLCKSLLIGALITILISPPLTNTSHASNNAKKEAIPIAPPYTPKKDTTQAIQPPFGLNWGESPENTQQWIKKNNHKSVQGINKDGRLVIETEGPFPDVTFNRIRFYFSEDQLTEVELQFNKILKKNSPEEEAQTYTDALELKSLIDSLHGKGHLIRHDEGSDKHSPWKYIHQVWTDEEHSIWLVVFHHKTTTPPQALSMTSIHYRWEKRLQKTPKEKKGKTQKPTPKEKN
jgi:hypothetical protein